MPALWIAFPNAHWNSWVALVLYQISNSSSKHVKVLSAHLKRSPESPIVESFSCLHRLYFKLYSELFGLSWTWIVSGLSATWCRCLHPLLCQHSPSYYSPNLIFLSEPPCVKDPFGTTWLLPSACCASLTACLAKAKLCPQADISLRTGSSWGKKYHYMEFSPLTTWVSHQIFYSCNRRNLKKSPKPASDQLQTPRDTSSSSLS